MTQNFYPIVEDRALGLVQKRAFRAPCRKADEIPARRSHDVLVYLSGGNYHLDNGSMDLSHEIVVNATHVSVVDMGRNTPVTVELSIPTSDSQEFHVVVTFTCTVDNALDVVRYGQRDAAIALSVYLREHSRIFELGLDHRLAAVNRFRLDVKAQIQAYAQLVPPRVPGMSVTLGSVEVRTPGELTKLSTALIDSVQGYEIAAAEQKHGNALETDRFQGFQSLESLRKDFERQMAIQEENFRQLMAAGRAQFARQEAETDHRSIGDDPVMALIRAHQAGEITAAELAARLQQGREEIRARQDAASQRDREAAWQHELWKREDKLREEANVRQDWRKAQEVTLAVFTEAVRHGYLDQADLNSFVSKLGINLENLPQLNPTASTSADAPRRAGDSAAEDMREEDAD